MHKHFDPAEGRQGPGVTGWIAQGSNLDTNGQGCATDLGDCGAERELSTRIGIIFPAGQPGEETLLLEILKLVAPLLGGGFAGALLNEWYRRKRNRLQRIPLIERINRVVDPVFLKGNVTLARAVGEQRELVELKKLRLYQLALRNTSSIHLQNVEIQFEFPAAEVQDFAAPRTTLSKTALLKIDAFPTEIAAFPTAFRWRIPHLPSGDSVEFTFQALDPATDKYVVALYNSDGVVVERVEGEPSPKGVLTHTRVVLIAALGMSIEFGISLRILRGNDRFTAVKEGGCDLRVVTSFSVYNPTPATRPLLLSVSNTRVIENQIFNAGQGCVVQSSQLDPNGPFRIEPGETITRERLTGSRPKLVEAEVFVGTSGISMTKTLIPLYVER